MTVTAAAKKILEDALALPDDQRMDLMAALSDSFEPATIDLSPEWKAQREFVCDPPVVTPEHGYPVGYGGAY